MARAGFKINSVFRPISVSSPGVAISSGNGIYANGGVIYEELAAGDVVYPAVQLLNGASGSYVYNSYAPAIFTLVRIGS